MDDEALLVALNVSGVNRDQFGTTKSASEAEE
jgi:hypothetical protein